MTGARPATVVKFGGSLLPRARGLLAEVRAWEGPCLVIPGGGPFADLVRQEQARHGFSDDAAHWMAVAGCEQYALLLADLGGLPLTDRLAAPAGPAVLAPYRLLRERDPLPHTWAAASDCIAAWCARELGARLVKATDVEGVLWGGRLVEEVDASLLEAEPPTCLDPLLPRCLREWRLDLLVVEGEPDVLGAALRGEPVGGTLVRGR